MNPIPIGPSELIVLAALSLSFAWYIAVLVLLFKIWQKVKRLPG